MEIRDLGYEHTPDGDETWIERREKRSEQEAYTINKVILVGTVAGPPDERTTANGGRVAYFSLATKRRVTMADHEVSRTDWHRIEVKGAELARADGWIRRGSRVYVEGQITYGSYERDGLSIPTAEIVAHEVTVLRRPK